VSVRLRILQAVPGHPDWRPNDEVDVDDDGEARDIVGRGEAEVIHQPKAETTEAERAPETADATPQKQPRSQPASRPKRAPAKRKPAPDNK
jgi:hypothetical protein